MGAECSVDRNQFIGDVEQTRMDNGNVVDPTFLNTFEFKNYKEYNGKMDLVKKKIMESVKRIEIQNEFTVKKE